MRRTVTNLVRAGRKTAVTALIMAGFLATSTLATPEKAAAQSGLVLENVAYADMVLDNDAGGGEYSSVLAYDRNGGKNQEWQVASAGGNPVQIKQRVGGQELCVGAVFNGTAEISMQKCEGNGGVVWWHAIQVGTRYVYRSPAQQRCMAVIRRNAPVELVECAFGDQAQQWVKRPA
ncbi:ricin-type beta-trefoil lectin domain protein [Streptomyces sp. NPDC003036]|uniref:ricin-type beta-trefoil lectin domain protein n=1 Tax=Streptomyces sp. NPDC003036 TaxID=3154442 RepID=UPI0033B5908B